MKVCAMEGGVTSEQESSACRSVGYHPLTGDFMIETLNPKPGTHPAMKDLP